MKTARKFLAALLALVMIICMLPATVVASSDQAHKDLAREAIGEGIVLLKNDDNVLPLDSSDKIALFGGGQVFVSSTSQGYQIGGGGSGWVNMDYVPEGPVDVLLEAANDGKVDIYKPLAEAYQDNVSYVPNEAMYDAAAAYADTAIMFLTRYSTEGSDISASNWYLSAAEETMLQTLTEKFEEVVVLINAPSMISTDWSLDGNNYGIDVDALLVTYMAGEMGAYGMADVLLGDVNPSGKLVDTYAMDINDYPSTETFTESNAYVRYTDDIYVGYRYFETFAPDRVAYPFGYGLSYTTFDINEISTGTIDNRITSIVEVTNTGDVAGKEVVQLYYKPPMKGEQFTSQGTGITYTATLPKAAINLGGYLKTDLLQPGETKRYTVSYPVEYMASFDDTGASGYESAYVMDSGEYEIYVGNSVRNIEKANTYVVGAPEVVEQLTELCPTNLDQRMVASVGENGNVVLDMEVIGETDLGLEPVAVAADAATTLEFEDSIYGGNMQTEAYAAGNGFLFDGTNWVDIGTGTVLGFLHNSANYHIYLSLDVAAAGTYSMGFVNGNGGTQDRDATDILSLSISADNGATWTAVEGFAFDSPNTNNAGEITGYQWWNLVYTTADFEEVPYEVTLPAGEVMLRFTVADTVADGYSNTNLDKLVLIPEGVTYTVADVIADIRAAHEEEEENNPSVGNVDLDQDYVGETVIKLQDVVDGTNTMSEFLAQMSLNELISFCSGYATGVNSGTGSIGTTNGTGEKYGIFSADTADGPAGIRLSTYYATYWPCSTLQACTWNTDLIEEIGTNVGAEALKSMVDIWLAPGMNIHRSPLCGRNFEYYSEDPVVTGKSAAALTKGVESTGVAVTLKHFCVNNKEGNRNSSDSRVSEKALREIYLKGFEIAINEADPECIMTSYNYLNGIETSENYDLLHGIVRNEWGWDGLFMTDWGNNSNIVNEVNAGNNVKMSTGDLNQLRTAVRNGTLVRETLEENAMYVLNALMDCPDFTINQYRVIDIAAIGTNHIDPKLFARRSYQSRFEVNGDNFHWGYTDQADAADGSLGFITFNINAEAAGEYDMFAVYGTTNSSDASMNIYVDGVQQNDADIPMSSTGAWTAYANLDMGTIYLPEGESVLKIQTYVGLNINDIYLTAVDQANYIDVEEEVIDYGEDAYVDVINSYEGLSSVTAVVNSDLAVDDVVSDYDVLYNPQTNEVIVWTEDEAGFAADEAIFTLVYDAPAGGLYNIGLEVLDATGVDSDWTILNAKAGSLLVLAKGDVNMDGRVTNADVIIIARYLVNLIDLNEKQLELADFDSDGIVKNADLIKVARYIVSY